MVDSDQYVGGNSAWHDETVDEISTDKETSIYENNNFKDSMSLKPNLTGKLRLGRLLGRGAFGEVYEGCSSDREGSWKKVAVKKLKGKSQIGIVKTIE